MTRPLPTTAPPKARPTAPAGVSWWASTADTWDRLGLDPAPMGPVRQAQARLERYNADRAAAHDAARATQHRLRVELARGSITFDKAAKEMAAATAAETLADPTMVRRAAIVLADDLTAEMRRTGDRLITDHLAPAVADLLTEAAPLVPVVAGVADEREAMRAPAPVPAAWSTLLVLAERLSGLQRLATRLRHEHILSVSRHHAFDVEYEYRNPDRIVRLGGVLGLVSLIEVGAEPYIGTADEVDALEEARGATPFRVPPKAKPPIVRRDGSLIGGSAA